MPANGYLMARVYTSNAAIPVEDATITVTQMTPEGIGDLLAIWLTDESGNTQMLMIPTPDPSVSESPSTEPGFSVVDVTAEHPLYERIIVKDVQIFPDTVSTQILQFVPLNQFPEAWDETEVFTVQPQNL